jgi:hypothetical protein
MDHDHNNYPNMGMDHDHNNYPNMGMDHDHNNYPIKPESQLCYNMGPTYVRDTWFISRSFLV